jgi:TolA-binding protein
VINEFPESPFAPAALYDLGLLYLNQVSGGIEGIAASGKNKDKQDDAFTQFARILDKYPESDKAADALFQMGQIASTKMQRRFEDAIGYYQRIIDEYPTSNHPAHFRQGEIYLDDLDQPEKALAAFEASMARPQEADKQLDAAKKKERILKMLAKKAAKGEG